MDIVIAVIAAAGALVGVGVGQFLTQRSDRKREEMDRRLNAGAGVLASIPEMSRRLTNLANLESDAGVDRAHPAMVDYHRSAIRWNAALSQGLAFLLPEQTDALLEIDREVDRLLDEATSKGWGRTEFRDERKKLGRLSLAFINDLRVSAGLGKIDAESIWSWAANPARD